MGVKNQKFIRIPESTEYINERGSIRFEDGRIIVRDYSDSQKTIAWTTDTPTTSGDGERLEQNEIFKVTQAQVTAGTINLSYDVASAANVRIHQIGSIPLINASVSESFFSSGNFSPDKPDFRATDQSDSITIRASDLSTNINVDDVIEVRYDVDSDQNTKIRQVINETPAVELVTITSTHITQGYFVLSSEPSSPDLVEIFHLGGIEQVNRSAFSAVELDLLPDLPDFAVADANADEPKAIYIRGLDFSESNDLDLSNKISGNIVSGDTFIICYRT